MSLSQKDADLSPRELKSLKKEELIRLVLKAKEKESPKVSRSLTSGTTSSSTGNRSSLGASSCTRPDHDVDWLMMKIKTAVVEAVQDLKSELRAEYDTKFRDMNEKFSKEIENLQTEISELRFNFQLQSKSLEKEILHDMRDTEMRKDNIMMFGLNESNAPTLSEGKECDLKLIQKLASELGVHNFEVSDCFRLGRRGQKPRPVKVTCRFSHQRSDLLRYAPQIRRLDPTFGFQKTFIKPDLSPKEQEANRQLRQELAMRREMGESVMIRGGRVVPRPILTSNNKD